MDALPGDGNIEALTILKEGRRKESINVDGDEWMYELKDDPAKQAAALESYGKMEKQKSLRITAESRKKLEQPKGRIEVEAVKGVPAIDLKVPANHIQIVGHPKGIRRFFCC